jgi:hypothetical protein
MDLLSDTKLLGLKIGLGRIRQKGKKNQRRKRKNRGRMNYIQLNSLLQCLMIMFPTRHRFIYPSCLTTHAPIPAQSPAGWASCLCYSCDGPPGRCLHSFPPDWCNTRLPAASAQELCGVVICPSVLADEVARKRS